jgi:hypothetical protein
MDRFFGESEIFSSADCFSCGSPAISVQARGSEEGQETQMKACVFNLCVRLFALATVLAAQSGPGTITGVVTDWDGVPLAGAGIKAVSASGAQFQVASEAKGMYTIGHLAPGTYQLTITAPGLKPFTKPAIDVQQGQALHVDAHLEDFENLNTLGDGRETVKGLFSETHQAPSGPAPRLTGGRPDFSGVWYSQRFADPGKPEPTAWAEAVTRERQENHLRDLPSSRCLPNGITFDGLFVPYRIVQTDRILVMIYENEPPRQIHLDGRPHPKDWDATYIGHLVGHWEGDELVVDTAGFNDKTWLDPAGHPHTAKMHVIERFRRLDLGHLETEITIEDPEAYRKPWSMKKVSDLAPNTEEVGLNVCAENNQDVAHLVGR